MASSRHDSDAHDSDVAAAQNVKHRPRGPTVKKNIIRARSRGERPVVSWNVRGQPIGKSGKELISFIESQVRQTIPITFSNWRERDNPVLDRCKEEFWCEIQKSFVVDDTHKDIILKIAEKSLRNFRTWLSKNWLRDENGNIRYERPPSYESIIGVDA